MSSPQQQGTKQPFTERQITHQRRTKRQNLAKARVDETLNLFSRKLRRVLFFHLPRASDMRGPVPDPLPPLGHQHTLLLWLFWVGRGCLGPTPPRSLVPREPVGSAARRSRGSPATPARAVSPADFRFGCKAMVRRPGAFAVFLALNQDVNVRPKEIYSTPLYARANVLTNSD